MRLFFGSVLVLGYAVGSVQGGDDDKELVRGKPVSDWVKELRDGPDAKTRRLAALALIEVKSPGAALVEALTRATRDADAGVRNEALIAIGRYGPKAKAAAPALMEIIRDAKKLERWNELRAFGNLQITSKEALQLLMDCAAEPNDDIRNSAFYAMRHFGADLKPALPLVLEALKDPKSRAAFGAVEALGGMGPAGREHLSALEPLLYRELLERVAAKAMVQIGGKDALPYLLKAIQDPKVRFRNEFLEPIRSLGADALSALPVLAPLLRDKETVGHNVGLTLASFGAPAVPLVSPMLGDDDVEVRRRCAGVLAAIAAKDEPAMQLLLKSLADKSPSTREGAARAMAFLGPLAKPAVPTLTALLKDEHRPVAWQAAVALARAGAADKKTVLVLAESLHQKEKMDVFAAVNVLGSLKEAARDALPTLIEQLKIDDGYHNSVVMRALNLMGPAARDSIPAVIATMAEDRWAAPMYHLSLVAADTLKAIGPDAIPPLIKALDSESKRLRLGALNALRQFGPEAKAAAPSLLRLLKSDDDDIARNAGLTLKRIDPEAAKKAGVK